MGISHISHFQPQDLSYQGFRKPPLSGAKAQYVWCSILLFLTSSRLLPNPLLLLSSAGHNRSDLKSLTLRKTYKLHRTLGTLDYRQLQEIPHWKLIKQWALWEWRLPSNSQQILAVFPTAYVARKEIGWRPAGYLGLKSSP